MQPRAMQQTVDPTCGATTLYLSPPTLQPVQSLQYNSATTLYLSPPTLQPVQSLRYSGGPTWTRTKT